MEKFKRRRFLLFMGTITTIALIGSRRCSNEKEENENEKENNLKKEEDMFNLKEELIQLIKSSKSLTVKWDCGGDQAIITTYVDGKEMDYSNKLAEKLHIYLINYLDLPDVGEFELEGEGTLMEDQGAVYIEYESIMKGYMDYGEDGGNFDEAEWKEVNEKEEDWSGKKGLFQ